jgi:hypothetical protein
MAAEFNHVGATPEFFVPLCITPPRAQHLDVWTTSLTVGPNCPFKRALDHVVQSSATDVVGVSCHFYDRLVQTLRNVHADQAFPGFLLRYSLLSHVTPPQRHWVGEFAGVSAARELHFPSRNYRVTQSNK